MTVVLLKTQNKLTARRGKGMTRDAAVERAEANVETLREKGVARIDELLESIQVLHESFRDDPATGLKPLYDASNVVGGLAPVFGFQALGAAAYSLCELLSHFEDGLAVNLDAVKIHVDGMTVLRKQDLTGPDEAAAIADHMARLVAHVVNQRKNVDG
jgi:hypothetical protein